MTARLRVALGQAATSQYATTDSSWNPARWASALPGTNAVVVDKGYGCRRGLVASSRNGNLISRGAMLRNGRGAGVGRLVVRVIPSHQLCFFRVGRHCRQRRASAGAHRGGVTLPTVLLLALDWLKRLSLAGPMTQHIHRGRSCGLRHAVRRSGTGGGGQQRDASRRAGTGRG